MDVNDLWYSKVTETLAELTKAINDAGPHPIAHQQIMQKSRDEWPTLWRAIDKLLSCR
jgi:hypothetical protein